MNLRKLLLQIACGAAVVTGVQSCNDDPTSEDPIINNSSVSVNGFSLKANLKVMSGLDSVFFSVDLTRGVIFNADSLPKGTDVTSLIPIISLPSSVTSAKITMEGGTKRQGEVDYKSDMSDSIDFSGKVTLLLGAANGNHKAYSVKVNVHKMEPDSLWWGTTAHASLPTRKGAPSNQRTIAAGDKTVCLTMENDGSYTLAQTSDPYENQWEKSAVSFPFTPKVRSLSYAGESYYILSTDGYLYRSADGIVWDSTGKKAENILGAYTDKLLYLSRQDDGLHFASYPETAGYPTGLVPADFPVSNYSNFHTIESKWWTQPVGLMYGGRTASGKLSGGVWSFDGTNWANIAANDFLPQLEGAVLVPYFAFKQTANRWIFNEHSVLMLIGGRNAEGQVNRNIYISYDNGVNWSLTGELMRMPDFIPGLWDLDATVANTAMEGNFQPTGWSASQTPKLPGYYKVDYSIDGFDVSWECPYIYLFGGRGVDGKLNDSIWRGVIRRLTFIPVL